MPNFYVTYEKIPEGRAPSQSIRDTIVSVYCHGDYNEADRITDFVSSFDRVEYSIWNSNGRFVGAFSLTLSEDMHLGRVVQYPMLYVLNACRGNREVLQLINWYSNRFAKSHNAKFIAKVKHVSPSKRIETFKEVK